MPNRPHLLVGALAAAAVALITSSSPLRGQGPRLRQIAAVTAPFFCVFDAGDAK